MPRATFDLEVLIDPTPENARRLLEALSGAGLATESLTSPQSVLANEITIFNDVVRVDVLTAAPGVAFSEAWARRERMVYHGQSFEVISKADLIASKRASGRDVDVEDARLPGAPEEPRGN